MESLLRGYLQRIQAVLSFESWGPNDEFLKDRVRIFQPCCWCLMCLFDVVHVYISRSLRVCFWLFLLLLRPTGIGSCSFVSSRVGNYLGISCFLFWHAARPPFCCIISLTRYYFGRSSSGTVASLVHLHGVIIYISSIGVFYDSHL